MSEAPETIDLCHFVIDSRIGEPAVIVEMDYGGPFDVEHGVEYTRPIPGKRNKVARSSRARLGQAYCSFYDDRIQGQVWDLAENREESLAKLTAKVEKVLAEELQRLRASLDGLTVKAVQRDQSDPRP